METIERPRAGARHLLRAPTDLRARLRYRLNLRRLAALILAGAALALAVADRAPTTDASAPAPTAIPSERRPSNRFDLAPDQRAVALGQPTAPLPLSEGDVVDILSVHASASSVGATATQLGTGRVLAVDDRAITIAVARHLVPTILESRATGTVELALATKGISGS